MYVELSDGEELSVTVNVIDTKRDIECADRSLYIELRDSCHVGYGTLHSPYPTQPLK